MLSLWILGIDAVKINLNLVVVPEEMSGERSLFVIGNVEADGSCDRIINHIALQAHILIFIGFAKVDRSCKCTEFASIGKKERVGFGSLTGKSAGKFVANDTEIKYLIDFKGVFHTGSKGLITTVSTKCSNGETGIDFHRSGSNKVIAVNTSDRNGNALGSVVSYGCKCRSLTGKIYGISSDQSILGCNLEHFHHVAGIDIQFQDRGYVPHGKSSPDSFCGTDIGVGKTAGSRRGYPDLNLIVCNTFRSAYRINGEIRSILNTHLNVEGRFSVLIGGNFYVNSVFAVGIEDPDLVSGSPGGFAINKLGSGCIESESKGSGFGGVAGYRGLHLSPFASSKCKKCCRSKKNI